MAAGRHGGYRSNEFKDRESVLDFKPRDHYYYAKHSDSHHRYHRDERSLVRSHDSGRNHDFDRNHDYDRRRERYERESIRSRPVDERYERPERETSRSRPVDERKARYHSSSIGNKVFSKSKDREPGELSSGSGSDYALAYDSQFEYKEVSKIDVEVQMPPAKKQKVASVDDVCVSPVDHKIITSSETSCLSHLERFTGSDHEMVELKEDDFVPARNIGASRWADEDEGEIVDDDDDDDDEYMRQNKSMSTDLGELHRESSEEMRAKSSESDGVHSSSTSECPLNDDNETEAEEDLDGGETPNYSDDSEEENESATPLQKTCGMLPGCRSVYEFERLGKISEGTYGVAHKAKDKKTGNVVALKKWKVKKDEREGFPITALREISILLSIQHPSVVDVKEVVMGGDDEVFMVMEYMEHDLKEFMEKMREPFSLGEVKCLMLQLLEGVKYLHDNWILHRDLKTSNILMNDRGELKICDFGLSRQYGSPSKAYTPKVVTQWYRAPELLLEAKQYSTAIDMWSLGCIMAELLAKEPLFNGTSELDQLNKIFRTLGTPNENTWPGFSGLPGAKFNFVKQPFNTLRKRFPRTSFIGAPCLSEAGFDLLNRLLSCDPQKRMTAAEAVNHEWFHEFPLPKSKDLKLIFPLSKLEDSMPRFSQQARERPLHRIRKNRVLFEDQGERNCWKGILTMVIFWFTELTEMNVCSGT